MATLKRFEDLKSWQEARKLVNLIYKISRQGPFSKDLELRGQIRRAAISVVSNIAEGFERGGTREFIQFLSYARGSAGEIKAQLYIALDQKYISPEVFDECYGLAEHTIRLISGLMRYLRKTKIKGSKYKSTHQQPETRN